MTQTNLLRKSLAQAVFPGSQPRQIKPGERDLFVGVFVAGIIEVVVPQEVVTRLIGQNTFLSNAIASTFGAFMYFATLTEVPIIQKLMGLGMGRGPALTLFLTGNALSLPSMIVLFKVMGKKQASAYILTIMVLSVIAGWLFGEMI